jgi:hypothetical protein
MVLATGGGGGSGASVDAAAARLIEAVAPMLHDEARMFARG